MTAALIVPFLLGCFAVLQVALNKRIAEAIGLTQAVILNAFVLLVVASVFWLYARGERQDFGAWMVGTGNWADFKVWWIIPGLCGLTLVAGMPWAAEKVGALQVFVVLVAAQMMFGIVWDHFVEGVQATPPRMIGAGLAVAGAWVTALKG